MLGIKFDTQLSFESHVSSPYKERSQKLHALARITDYINPEKRKVLNPFHVIGLFLYPQNQ